MFYTVFLQMGGRGVFYNGVISVWSFLAKTYSGLWRFGLAVTFFLRMRVRFIWGGMEYF